MLKELKELEPKHYLIAALTVFALVVPGFMCLFHYKPALVLSLDVIKLLVLSISITLPFALVNFLILGLMFSAPGSRYAGMLDLACAISTFMTAAGLYLALYIAYLFQFTFRHFTFAALLSEVVIVAGFFKITNVSRQKAKRECSNKPSQATP